MTRLIAMSRQAHYPVRLERFTKSPSLEKDATEVEKMRHLLQMVADRGLKTFEENLSPGDAPPPQNL
jgi:hypothetical protein